jgi:hypothetical protein
MSDERGIKPLGQIVQIDEARIRGHRGEKVRRKIEETLPSATAAASCCCCPYPRFAAYSQTSVWKVPPACSPGIRLVFQTPNP